MMVYGKGVIFRNGPYEWNGFQSLFNDAIEWISKLEEAIKEYKKTLHLTPNHFIALWGLSVCYGLLGQEEESREAATEMMKINPNFTINAWKTNSPYKNRDLVERWTEVLRKAGVPEG